MPQVFIPREVSRDSLIFDDQETKSILTFFWPTLSADIQALAITDNIRHFAQMLIINAIDASYSMGFIDAIFGSIFGNPHAKLKSIGQKLAMNFAKHLWQHARFKDLQDVKIYESVRATVAQNFKETMAGYLNGTLSLRHPSPNPFYLARDAARSSCWS